MNKIQDADIKNKKILLRLDLNVPMKNGEIESDKRIREAIPTIKFLADRGANQMTIITHLGKPKGGINMAYSLQPIANRLAELLSSESHFDGPQKVYNLSSPSTSLRANIVMFENLRFNPGEEENNRDFAKELVSGRDIFVNDAFGTCHRAHASTAGVAEFLPSYAGLLVQKEIENLEKLLHDGEKPFTVILGGAKIADKLPVINNLISRADNFLLGGAIGNTFLAARRHYLGHSLLEPEAYNKAALIWQNITSEPNRNIYLPEDIKISKSAESPDELKEIDVSETLKPNFMDNFFAVDIGAKTIVKYQDVIFKSKVIFWNGNMGISEVPEFANGTKKIAEAISKSTARIVIGGGDTVAAVEAEFTNNIGSNIFLSTGGGATLEFLAGKQLPGLKALGYK